MVGTPRARATLYEVDGKWPRKFGLRVIQNVLSIAAIGCAASTLIAPVQTELPVPAVRTVIVYIPAVSFDLWYALD
jgi:hypothetical protein